MLERDLSRYVIIFVNAYIKLTERVLPVAPLAPDVLGRTHAALFPAGSTQRNRLSVMYELRSKASLDLDQQIMIA